MNQRTEYVRQLDRLYVEAGVWETLQTARDPRTALRGLVWDRQRENNQAREHATGRRATGGDR
jgi:hypothetical protein